MSFPLYHPFNAQAFTELVRIARAGTMATEYVLGVKCAYMLGSFALGATVGEPVDDGEPIMRACDVPLEDLEAAVLSLESLAAIVENTPVAAAEDGERLDPATIAMIVQLVSQLIIALINRRKTN